MIVVKTFLIILLGFFIGCQDYNSNTFDAERYGPTDLTGGTQFIAAYPVLQKNCMSCHTHANWSAFKDEQQWINEGLVVAGDADDSDLVRRILNTGRTDSDMPVGGGPLPTADYQKIVDWVNGL